MHIKSTNEIKEALELLSGLCKATNCILCPFREDRDDEMLCQLQEYDPDEWDEIELNEKEGEEDD